jgi:hypothetical protein
MPKPRKNTPSCGAKTKHHGKCRKQAGWGTDHLGYGPCRLHGGATRAHRKRAAEQMALDEMHRQLGMPVFLAQADERTVRRVALRVIDAMDGLSVEQQIAGREALNQAIEALQQPIPYERAQRLARRRRQRERRDERDPSQSEDAVLDARSVEADEMPVDRAATDSLSAREEQILNELAHERRVIRRRRKTSNPPPQENA